MYFLGSAIPLYTVMWVGGLVRITHKKNYSLNLSGGQFLQYKCTQDFLPGYHYNRTKQCVYAISG